MVEGEGGQGVVEVETTICHEQRGGGIYMVWSRLEVKVGIVVAMEEEDIPKVFD